MTNNNKRVRKSVLRKALFSSAISLILCCAMLVGTTFAWFTDSVTSSNNIIKSGNLDVELYYQVEGSNTWIMVDSNTNVFMKDALWEPGHTEVVKLKVVNAGTLALKYQLGVNVARETSSVNVNGEKFNLSDYIKFDVVADAEDYSREKAVEAVDATATALKTAYNSGTTKLLPKTDTNSDNEDIVTMVVYMPTSVGNEANYAKGAAVPTIDLGINLFATQVEAEIDSFGDDYDKNAWHEEFSIATATELQNALEKVKDGGVIKFASNVTIDAATAGYNDGTYVDGIRYTGDKSFTIDLNGYTFTDDGAVNDYLLYLNNKGEKANEITLKNGTLISKNGCWSTVCVNSSAATQETVLNLVNMNIINSNDAAYSGNLAVRARDKATVNVNNGTVITSDGASYGIAAGASNSIININNGATIIQKNSGTSGGNSVFTAVGGKGTININDGAVITSDKYGVHNMTTGTPVVNVKGGTITADVALMASTNGGAGQSATFNVTGGVINGKLETYTDNAHIIITGGTFSVNPTNYVAADYKAVPTGAKFEVIKNNVNFTYATASTVEELQTALEKAADQNLIVLTADIAGDVTVKQIKNLVITVNGDGHKFAGTFIIDGNSAQEGTSGVTLKNINFVANSISSDAVVRLGDGTSGSRYTANAVIENCYFDVPDAVGIKSYTGGDINLTIKGCTTSATLHSLAQLKGVKGVLVEDCYVTSIRGINFNNSDNITVKNSTIDVQKYAVRFGSDENTTVENYAITGCTLKSANVNNDAAVVLREGATNANLTLTNTTITATIEMTGHENANVDIQ